MGRGRMRLNNSRQIDADRKFLATESTENSEKKKAKSRQLKPVALSHNYKYAKPAYAG